MASGSFSGVFGTKMITAPLSTLAWVVWVQSNLAARNTDALRFSSSFRFVVRCLGVKLKVTIGRAEHQRPRVAKICDKKPELTWGVFI